MRIFETSIEKTERVEKDGRVGNMSYLKKYPELEKIEFDEGQKNNIEQLKKLVSNPSIDVIGLEGKWGTGKSTILEALQDQKNCYVYDLWAHQEDNLRYSFLKGMLAKLKPESFQEDGILNKVFKKLRECKIIKKWYDENVKNIWFKQKPKPQESLLNHEKKDDSKEYEKLEEEIENLISSRKESKGPQLNYRMAGMIFVLLFLPILANIANALWEDIPWTYIMASFSIPMGIVFILYHYGKNKSSFNDKINGIKHKKIYEFFNSLIIHIIAIPFSVLLAAFIACDVLIGLRGNESTPQWISNVDIFFTCDMWNGMSVQEVLVIMQLGFVVIFLLITFLRFSVISRNPFFLDALSLYNDKLIETSYLTEIQPRMENVQEFLKKFETIRKKHYIIIFDNLDRLPNDKIKEFWTFLQTFFVEKRDDKRTVIVAFDRERVIEAFDNEQIGNGYLEKSLDITLNVPECTRFDLKRFFLERWDLAFQDFEFKKKTRMDEDIKLAGSNAFEIFFQQSLSNSPENKSQKNSISIHTRRNIVEFINDIYLKIEIYAQLFPSGMIKRTHDKVPIKYPFEMVSLFVVKKNAINRMFSETVNSDSTRYYIDAYGDYQDWIDVFVPGRNEEEKKLIVQDFCNALILNKLADDQDIYLLRDYYKKGRLDFYCKWIGNEEDVEKDFDYLFNYALQRIDDNENVLNLAKSLIFCRKKIEDLKSRIENLKGKIENSWNRLFIKMERINLWPSESWFWNAFLSDAKICLNEIVPPDNYGFSEKREFFIVEKIRSNFNQNAVQEEKHSGMVGKICLPSTYLTDFSFNFSKHTIEKDGKLFFYDGNNEKEVVKQLKELETSDWERSLENFWNPGILQLDKVKNKAKCKLENLDKAVKMLFENYMNVMKNGTYEEKLKLIHFDDSFRWGTLNETDYFEKWEWIILRLSKDDRKRLFGMPNINCCFPDGMYSIIKKIMENDGVVPQK